MVNTKINPLALHKGKSRGQKQFLPHLELHNEKRELGESFLSFFVGGGRGNLK